MFRCALCHLGERELRWLDPGSPLTGGVCCRICCVQRGSESTWLVLHPTTCRGLAGATAEVPWGAGCCGVGGCQQAAGWIGHFEGQRCDPQAVGCVLGCGVHGCPGLSSERGFAWF